LRRCARARPRGSSRRPRHCACLSRHTHAAPARRADAAPTRAAPRQLRALEQQQQQKQADELAQERAQEQQHDYEDAKLKQQLDQQQVAARGQVVFQHQQQFLQAQAALKSAGQQQ
jgi:hypothetical protein